MDRDRMNILQALHWAFGVEHAQLDLPDLSAPEDRGTGVGMEWVMIQRARLGGVQIDTSVGRSYAHDDADDIAAQVAQMPKDLGGRGMAIWVSQLARSDLKPDWMRGAVPKIEPIEWKRENQHGRTAKTEFVGRVPVETEVPHPRNPTKRIKRTKLVEVRCCPCTWNPSLQEIESCRRDYEKWWQAIDHVRFELRGVSFTKIHLSDWMPPRRPWRSVEAIRVGGTPRATIATR